MTLVEEHYCWSEPVRTLRTEFCGIRRCIYTIEGDSSLSEFMDELMHDEAWQVPEMEALRADSGSDDTNLRSDLTANSIINLFLGDAAQAHITANRAIHMGTDAIAAEHRHVVRHQA